MDFIFNRYASPYFLLDDMIEQNRLHEFVKYIYKTKSKEKVFDIWLHKVDDKSFNDFYEECKALSTKPSRENLEAAIKNSIQMLNNFIPS